MEVLITKTKKPIIIICWNNKVKILYFLICSLDFNKNKNINNDNTGYIGKYADGWGWWGNGSSAQTVNNNNNVNCKIQFINNNFKIKTL